MLTVTEGVHFLGVVHCFAQTGLLSLAFQRTPLLRLAQASACFRLLSLALRLSSWRAPLNEMLSVQERLRKHGIAFGAGLPGPPAGQAEASASSSYAPAVTPALGTTMHTTGLQHRADLFPTFWGEPVSAFHGRMGYSANVWLHHFESLRPEDQLPEIRDNAFWVRKFPLNDSGGVALSDLRRGS